MVPKEEYRVPEQNVRLVEYGYSGATTTVPSHRRIGTEHFPACRSVLRCAKRKCQERIIAGKDRRGVAENSCGMAGSI